MCWKRMLQGLADQFQIPAALALARLVRDRAAITFLAATDIAEAGLGFFLVRYYSGAQGGFIIPDWRKNLNRYRMQD